MQSYATTLEATGGDGATYSWSLTIGSLPPGLGLGFGNGMISGTPTAAGTSTFTVQVSSGGQTASKAFSLTINNPPVTITTSSPLPDGTRSVAYSDTLRAGGGDGTSYSWSVTAGSLPQGLSLGASDGVIRGAPTAAGTSTFTVQVSSGGQAGSMAFALTVNHPPVSITTTSPLPDGTRGASYADTLRATGGDGTTYSWSVTNATLPEGLTLSAAGLLSGTPAAEGTSTFTVRAGSGGQMADKTLDLKVNPPKQFPLQVTIVGAGTVRLDPSGIICVAICMALFDSGTVVTLTPAAAAGWEFAGWAVVGGDCGIVIAIFPPLCAITMTGPRTVTARFTQFFELKVRVSDQGTVTSSPAGINAPRDSTERYPSGTMVTLTPTAAAGWQFSSWADDGARCGGNLTCGITMSSAKLVTATFTQVSYELEPRVMGQGTVGSSPEVTSPWGQGGWQEGITPCACCI